MDYFISYKQEITDFLTTFLIGQQEKLKDSRFSKDVFKRLVPLVMSGKMWRGSLLINTYQYLAGKKYSSPVLQTAAALELIGSGLLVHDDVIDQDEQRRGQTTLHTQYRLLAQQKKYQQPQRFGKSLAICVGDLVFFLAYELLSGKLIKLFTQQLSKTILGEMQDVELALINDQEVNRVDILQMYSDKTASYTTSLPLMAGAMLAQQDQQLILQLNELGKTLGLIFQLKDDEIGLFGDRKKTGKPVGADIREGKKTLYYYYLEQKVPHAFAKNEVEGIMTLMRKHQIDELVTKDLEELEVKAQWQMKKLATADLKKMLKEFLGKNLNREK